MGIIIEDIISLTACFLVGIDLCNSKAATTNDSIRVQIQATKGGGRS